MPQRFEGLVQRQLLAKFASRLRRRRQPLQDRIRVINRHAPAAQVDQMIDHRRTLVVKSSQAQQNDTGLDASSDFPCDACSSARFRNALAVRRLS